MTTDTGKLANARAYGQAQFDSIVELVEALEFAQGKTPEEISQANAVDHESAECAIRENALSVEVRSGWYDPNGHDQTLQDKPFEYRILLCTGGPAVQIRGELSQHGEPITAHLEVQDWLIPWAMFYPKTNRVPYDTGGNVRNPKEILLTYARCFYFGE